MIIYESTKIEFMADVQKRNIDNKIIDLLNKRAGIRPNSAEIRSFRNSLLEMYMVLLSEKIANSAGIALEYKIPNNSKRVDFIISGYDTKNKQHIIIIELKQWEKIRLVSSKDGVINLVETYVGGSNKEVVHPSYQAFTYSEIIKNYNENVEKFEINVIPCAYLHNYERVGNNEGIFASQYRNYLEKAPSFIKGDVEKLQDFITKYIKKGDNKSIIYQIEQGRIKPSKSLQDKVKSMVLGNPEFMMIDNQKVIYENIKAFAKKTFEDRQKIVYIVEGGPGTGKSVLAIQSLSNILSQGKTCMYVTKNAAPKNVMKRKLSEGNDFKRIYVDLIMKGSAGFVDSQKNEVDCVLVDEAHRLIPRSQYARGGENQVKEIIHAASLSVFFIDETQRVTFEDIGSIEEIKKWARYHNAQIYQDVLDSQFRCNGSDGYIAWLDNLLEIRETANEYFLEEFDYVFIVFDDPNELRNEILEMNKINNKSRLVAGYCWDWLSHGRNDPDHFDIVLEDYDFKMSWNLNNTGTYAIDDHSVNQIGCIHTVQGLEFDYVGVIIGKDMRYEDNRIITDYTKRAKTDRSLWGLKALLKDEGTRSEALIKADAIIRNTYKTLMTRGQKGCYVYCEDKKLSQYLKEMKRVKSK